mmetsp:Transcript_20091/g.42135  ORF Transcript_20091/g.42135 Transcript_20091/m.42135 type:complete len:668 (-) Transcript_20091:106-2109(-)
MKFVFVLAALACCTCLVLAMNLPPPSPSEAHFIDLSAKFRKFHSDPINVALHFFTTPLGVLAVLSLINKVLRGTTVTTIAMVIYCVSLIDKLPPQLIAMTSLCVAGLTVASAQTMALGWLAHAGLFCVGYFGQDLSHFATGEATFQSSYQQDSDFWSLLTEHTYYLLPLVFESAMPNHMDRASYYHTAGWMSETAYRIYHLLPLVAVLAINFVSKDGAMSFPWQFQRSRVLTCKLTSPEDVADLDRIRAWTMAKGPSRDTSSHWWHTAPSPETPAERVLPAETRAAFDRIATCKTIRDMFDARFSKGWRLEVLNGMNEVYVSSPTTVKNTSDEVFYTRHIDGPYYFVPFASCFRMIIGMDKNEEISTIFPMVPQGVAAQKGDVLAFDFHREVHYIRKQEGVKNDDFRIVLKVHYCIYPTWALPFGKLMGLLSTRYNKLFRALFLATIAPDSLVSRFMAWNVVFWTKVVYIVEMYFGYSNIAYLVALGALWALVDYRVFLVGTSFVHYLRYINTYYHREGVAYGDFKRDALLYKTLAVGQIVALYAHAATKGFTDFSPAVLDPVGLAMVVGGYALSAYCTSQLGVDGTYFGIELGMVPMQKNYVQRFPYGVIPHPMILSQCVALLGFHKNEAFRQAMPFLVPAHVALYLVHMLQEHFDIHATRKAKKA